MNKATFILGNTKCLLEHKLNHVKITPISNPENAVKFTTHLKTIEVIKAFAGRDVTFLYPDCEKTGPGEKGEARLIH